MRRTRIVCTIGPASDGPDVLRQLIAAGMDVARLNFSHGNHEGHAAKIRDIRDLAREAGRPVAILQDLAGPKVRIGALAGGSVRLEPGGRFVLTARDVPGDADAVSVTYADLPRDVSEEDTLLLADGALELRVEAIDGPDIVCRVVTGGELSSHKGINLPSGSIQAPIIGDRDRDDIRFGVAQGVDYIGVSFVRTAEDVRTVRAFLSEIDSGIPLIAKIERREAVSGIDTIVQAVDGLMVARGDLGVDIPMEQVPRVQKTVIQKANQAGKPVITATQMLRSMVDAPRPTRAEVADVANAILDGTDAVMLSEETAVGRHPAEAVRTMGRIAAETDPAVAGRAWYQARRQDAPPATPDEAVAAAACRMADSIHAAAILTCTQSGSTTRLVAKYRPQQPVLAATPDEATFRRLCLVWGCVPLLVPAIDDLDDMQAAAIETATAAGLISPGDTVVITAGLPLHVPGTTNLIKVETIGPEPA